MKLAYSMPFSLSGNQKKRSSTICAAHKRIVEFWSADPSKAMPCLWAAAQEALKWMEDNKKQKDKKAK